MRSVGKRRLAIGLVVFLVGSFLFPGSTGATAAPRTTARELFEKGMGSLREQIAERQLSALGIPDSYIQAMRDRVKIRAGRFMFAESAPDLNRDGVPEVFEMDERWRITVGEGGTGVLPIGDETKTRISVLSGDNGHELWHRKFDTSAWMFSMRVGDKGRPGVVVIRNIWSFFQMSDTSTLIFDAFDARGKHLWSRSYHSSSSGDLFTWVAADYPMTISRIDGLPGKADDLLIGLSTMVSTLATSTATTRTVVIDGRTGREVVHPIVDVGVDFLPIAGPVGDLDEDGFEDFASTAKPGVAPGAPEPPGVNEGTVHARRGPTGLPIWSTSGVEMEEFAYAWELPNVAGDFTADIAVDTVAGNNWRSYVLDGFTGKPLWHRDADWLHAPGDVNGDGLPDLVASSWRIGWEKGRFTFKQEALTGKGKTLWRQSSVWNYDGLPCPKNACGFRWSWTQPDVSSDVEPDAVDETLLDVEVGKNIVEADRVSRLYDGDSGRLVLSDDDDLESPGVAIDGRGSDLIRLAHTDDGDLRIEAIDGRGAKLWGGRLDSPDEIVSRKTYYFTDGLVLPGDRCGDVLVDFFLEENTYYAVFDGATGRVLWSRWDGAPDDRPRFAGRFDHNRAC